jgi:hypothetical protein
LAANVHFMTIYDYSRTNSTHQVISAINEGVYLRENTYLHCPRIDYKCISLWHDVCLSLK